MGSGSSSVQGNGGPASPHGKPANQKSDSMFAHRSWVLVAHAVDSAETTRRIVCGLQEGGLLVRGDRIMTKAPKKREELMRSEGCGAYLAIITKGFQKSKQLKPEFERALKQGLPMIVVMAGPLEFEPSAEWLMPSIESMGGTSKLLDFRNPESFESQMAMLMLKLQPNHVSAFARELSSIAVDVPTLRASDAVQALHDTGSDLKACRAVLRDIVGLTLDASSGHILAEAEIMLELKAVFELFGLKSPEVALSICWAIGNMLACTEGLEETLYAQGAAEIVMRSMGAHEKDPAVQQHGCLALQRLVHSDMLIDAGIISAIQSAIKDHSNDNNVQLQAIRLVQAIIISSNISDVNKKKVADKLSSLIKKAIKTFPDGSLLHEAAAHCSHLIKSVVKEGKAIPTLMISDNDAADAADAQPSQGSVSDIKDLSSSPIGDPESADAVDGNGSDV